MAAAALRARGPDGAVFADRLRAAHTHWTRLRGLLGTRALPSGGGLWLRPCRQVHMFGMRYAVDLVFLDAHGRVLETVPSLPPNSVSPCVSAAASVLELPVGTIARAGLLPGAAVTIEGEAAASDAFERLVPLLGNAGLAALYAFFAAAHLAHARRTGQWATTLPIVLQEALLVGLFLSRRRSLAYSHRLGDWVLGIAGTWLPLLFRATATTGSFALGALLQVLGLGWAIAGALSLGRSIGVVAGNRGLKTAGLYRIVRHPMYAGYLLSYLGYLAAYPTPRNAAILAAGAAALIGRALVEERFLAGEPAYRAYTQRVRWRLVPYVW